MKVDCPWAHHLKADVSKMQPSITCLGNATALSEVLAGSWTFALVKLRINWELLVTEDSKFKKGAHSRQAVNLLVDHQDAHQEFLRR